MSRNKIKVGVIGLGVGNRHARIYHDMNECSLEMVCDFNKKTLKDFNLSGKNILKTQDYKKLISNPDLDLISIASYDNYHATQVLECLKFKKHVFVEKPICLNESELNKIVKSSKLKPSIKLSSNFVLRSNENFKYIKTLIDKKKVGTIYHLEGEYNYGRLKKLTEGWRGQIPFYSVVYGGAVHIIDLIIWLTGKKVMEVSSAGNNISTKKSIFKFNDTVVSIFKFFDGSTAKITSNFASVCPHHHTLSIYGTKKTITHNIDGTNFFSTRNPNIKHKKLKITKKNSDKDKIIQSFVKNIYYKKNYAIVKKSEIFDAMSISLAIEKSVKSNKWVKVKYTK